MTASRFGRTQKATALVPLALLSAAWTASLAGAGASPVSAASDDPTPSGGTSVPTQAIEAPASVSVEEAGAPGSRGFDGDVEQIVATSSTNGIPSAALAAYQRAETVINAADKSCNLTWQLVAAIGRIESNHGRFGGSALGADGVATPAILGPVLDGAGGFARILDTDAGQYDGSATFDRAVGPMQFIPSTWSVVGVDADNDGTRDPQDIDDAALATAVYLCSGPGDLSTTDGQRTAVYRYNHSQTYVDTVLSVMDAYLEGDFTSVPNSTIAAGTLSPLPVQPQPTQSAGGQDGTGDDAAPAEPTEPTQPADEPTEEPTQPGNGGGNGGDDDGDDGGPSLPLPPVKVPDLPDTNVGPVDDLLTTTEAVLQCTLDGLVNNPLTLTDKFDECVEGYTTEAGYDPKA